MTLDYWPIFVILAIAWIVPIVLSALEISRVPAVIVEIIAGVIIGPDVLGIVEGNEPNLGFLANTGFLFLIFLSGLAIDVDKIISSFPRKKIRSIDLVSNTFLLSFLLYLGGLILALPAAYVVNALYGIDLYFMLIAIASIALSIIVPIIKNDGEINKKFGQVLLQTGAISTISTILLIAIYSGAKRNGFQFELLLFLLIFVVFFAAYKIGNQLVKIRSFKKLLYQLDHAASQIRIRGSIAILLLFIVIASWVNTEQVLGAFIAGILLSIYLSKQRSSLLFKLDGMGYGFFIPLFFIMVGVKLDLDSLNNFQKSLPLIGVILLAFYSTQLIPALLMTKLFGVKKAMAAGVLLTSRLGMTIAVCQIGMALELIGPATNTAIVVAAICTTLLSPTIYGFLNRAIDHFYSIYIVGGGTVGAELANRLKLHSVPHLVIELNKARCENLKSMGLEVKNADGEALATYLSLKIRPTDTIVLLTQSEKRNVKVAKMLKNELEHTKMITSTLRPDHLQDEQVPEEVQVVNVQEVVAAQIENEILRPTTVHALTDSFGTYSVEEVKVTKKEVHRKLVKDFPFPTSGSLIVIRREQEVFIPHGDTHILNGDIVTVIGNTQALQEFRSILE
jgi:Kef-type K+ transport system membrane component KefB